MPAKPKVSNPPKMFKPVWKSPTPKTTPKTPPAPPVKIKTTGK